MFIDASRYLNIYDPDLILSWTPKEYQLFLKGCEHKQIDEYERHAAHALMNAKAQNSKKRVRMRDLFDADKARRKIDGEEVDVEKVIEMNRAFKGFKPDFKPKGG